MKNITFLRTTAITAAAAVSFLSYAGVASAAAIISNWQDPVPYSFVSFNSSVIINGAYTLPPNWVGTIYVIQDGVQLPQQLTVDNLGGASAKSASFSINLGIQPPLPNPHSIQLNFFGGTKCYIDSTCPGTPTNNADEYTVPRNYTASGSPDPILFLSYDAAGTQPLTSPALNFSNTVLNTPADRTIYARNIGGGVATGVATVSSGPNPFYCMPNCSYAIPAGSPAVPIDIQYLPNIVNMTDTAMLNFSCTAPNCAGVNASVTGNSVPSSVPPQIDFDKTYMDFGMQNIGKPPQTQVLTISNTGGGILSGQLVIPGTDFTCVSNPTCSFNVPAGVDQMITVRFNPTTAGVKDVMGTLKSNGGADIPFELDGWGNNKPLIDITCVGCEAPTYWNVGQIAVASTVNADVEIDNVGVGTVAGRLDPTPGTWTTHGWSCTSVTEPDGTVVTPLPNQPCTFYGVTNGGTPAIAHMSYTGLGPPGTVWDTVDFTDTANPGDRATLIMASSVILGQLNINVDYEFWVDDALVNNSYHPSGPSIYPIEFENDGAGPIVVTFTIPTGAGVFTCNIDGVPCVYNTPNTLTFAGNEEKVLNMIFTPLAPIAYDQVFTVCMLSNCVDYTMHGQGQDPRISVVPVVPNSKNEDLWTICASDGNPCNFTGTKLVYFGNDVNSKSKSFTGGVSCVTASFGSDPTPGKNKYCWYANPDGGTWLNAPWTTGMLYRIDNAGTGGVVEYKMTGSAHFLCSDTLSRCQGHNTNPDNYSGGYYDADYNMIYFNPTAAGPVSETIKIEYDYVAWKGHTPTDCPGGATTYCHSFTVPPLTHSGTGLAGPRISTVVGTFPLTNIGATSVATLSVLNTGTSPLTNVKVVDGTNPHFHCSTNCGPFTLNPGGIFDAVMSYTASVAGTENGTLNITSTELPAAIVAVSGSGNNLPQIGVTPNSPGFLDYGTVNEGSQVISGDGIAPIIVKNTGAAPLSGDATVTSGGTDFKCISCHYGPLNPGESVEIKIAFAPTDVTLLSGTVSFSGGGGATLQLVGRGQLGASSFNSTDANFGRVLIKTGNFKEQLVVITNNGSVAIPSGTISFQGGAGSPFSCVPPTPMDGSGNCTYPNVAPNGGTVSFTIRFTPIYPGVQTDKIKFSGSANAKVTVIGTGVVPSVKFKEK